MIGDLLWSPAADLRQSTEFGRYMTWLGNKRARDFASYEDLWQWSVGDLDGFWSSIADFFGIRFRAPYERVLGAREMPGAQWFPGARLNYAEHMLGGPEDGDRVDHGFAGFHSPGSARGRTADAGIRCVFAGCGVVLRVDPPRRLLR